jgi:hypothetical protein
VQPISDPDLLKYLDESIRCAETNCIRASVVLAWCAVAFKVHQKLVSLMMPVLTAEFGKMKADKGLMFRTFTRDYTFTTALDVQEAADAHLILMCRFLTYLDDTQYKHLKRSAGPSERLRPPDWLPAGSGEVAGLLFRHHAAGAAESELRLIASRLRDSIFAVATVRGSARSLVALAVMSVMTYNGFRVRSRQGACMASWRSKDAAVFKGSAR